MPLFL